MRVCEAAITDLSLLRVASTCCGVGGMCLGVGILDMMEV
jgi:hypothetical protein